LSTQALVHMIDNMEYIAEDAAYLIDELEALKPLLPVIPYSDQPGDSLSVLNLIELIDFVQQKFLAKLQAEFTGDLKQSYHFDLNTKTLRVEFINQNKKKSDFSVDVNLILSSCINNRHEIITAVQQILSSVNDKLGRETINGALRSLVNFERLIFKEIAERVLTIDPQKNNGL